MRYLYFVMDYIFELTNSRVCDRLVHTHEIQRETKHRHLFLKLYLKLFHLNLRLTVP